MCEAEIAASRWNLWSANTSQPLAQPPHRRPRQVLVRGIHLGQRSDIDGRVPPGEIRTPRRLLLDTPRVHPAPDEPGHLRPAQARDLGQVVPHDPFLSFLQPAVWMRLQHPLDEPVDRCCLHCRPTHVPIGRHKLLHLGQAQPLQILHADCHSSAASDIFVSGSFRAGINFRFQARLALESNLPFRLIPHWTILGFAITPRKVL
jgi:hypothetical protein